MISGLSGDSTTYVEGSITRARLDIGQPAGVTDADNANFNGGSLTVTITNAVAGDQLWFGERGGISNTSTQVTFNGTPFATFNAVGDTRIFTFNANATPAAVAALIRAMEYVNSGTNDTTTRTVSFTLADGSGGTTTASTSIVYSPVNDAPVNIVPLAQNGTEDTNLVFSTATGNAISVADVDATTLTVTLTVTNGRITLATTAGLTIDDGANGTATVTVTGTPAALNAALNGLIYRGNLNYQGADTLTITTSDNGQTGSGGTLTDVDTIAITLADDGRIDGDAGNNVFSGTPLADYFNLSQGGDDTVSGLGGNDGFYFGAAYTNADIVDGGDGALDQIGLQGNYAGVTLGAFTNVELLVLLPGNDNRFGDNSNNFYDYNLVATNSTVADGEVLVVQANTLRAGEDFTLNGAAELDGSFLVYAGFGADILTGGAMDDGFLFGDGRFGSGDIVNGGGGSDQLGLQGDFNITFGANQLSSIELIALLSASDGRFGSTGGTVGYTLTMNNGNVAANAVMTISANTLLAGESLVFNGLAEADGSFRIYSGGANDSLSGSQNSDIIFGGAGDDVIRGGAGADQLTGGAGNDRFEYHLAADSTSAARDRILDFEAGDKIDLTQLAANTGGGSFSFIGASGPTAARQLQVSQTGNNATISVFIDGDTIADLVIEATVATGYTLTLADFDGAIGQGSEAIKLEAPAVQEAFVPSEWNSADWDMGHDDIALTGDIGRLLDLHTVSFDLAL